MDTKAGVCFRPPRLGPLPYTISVLKSFGGSFVRMLRPWIAHLAAGHPLSAPRSGVTAPYTHTSGTTAHRPSPLEAGARSTRRGLRVGLVESFGLGFVWVAKLRIA